MSIYIKLNYLILNIELVLSPPDIFYTMLIKYILHSDSPGSYLGRLKLL